MSDRRGDLLLGNGAGCCEREKIAALTEISLGATSLPGAPRLLVLGHSARSFFEGAGMNLERIKQMLEMRRSLAGDDETDEASSVPIVKLVTPTHFAAERHIPKGKVMELLKLGALAGARKVSVPDRPKGVWLIPVDAVLPAIERKQQPKGGASRHKPINRRV